MNKKTMIHRIIIATTLSALFVMFYSCSDLMEKMWSDDGDGGVVGGVEVVSGYIDSTEGQVWKGTGRFDDFVLRFPVSRGGGEYEIRLSSNPITQENWDDAQKVECAVLSTDSGGFFYVNVHLQPRVDWNACTGCGECVKPRGRAVHRTWSYLLRNDTRSVTHFHDSTVLDTISIDSVCERDTAVIATHDTTLTVYKMVGNEETQNENTDPRICPRNAISVVDGKARIDATKCTACGACFKACPYNAISDCAYGRYYYFGVKTMGNKGESSGWSFSTDRYKIVYDNVLLKDSVRFENGLWQQKLCNMCRFSGCHANHQEVIGDSCKCVEKKDVLAGCPVGALYANSDTTSGNPDFGAIYIDPAKCINCGICFERCMAFGKHSILRKVVAAGR